MKKRKKLKLVKGIVIGTIITTISSSLFFSSKKTTDFIPYTESELEYLKNFETELKYLEEAENIKFKNKELFDIVSNQVEGELTTQNIKEIKELEITTALINNDLSDLKYLTNLRYLRINENTVDLSCLEFNQNLYSVCFKNCNLYNSHKLPNSIEILYLRESNLMDYTLSVPYNLQTLNLQYSPITKLHFKNPDSLKELYIIGGAFFSVTELLNCNNLKCVNLEHCYDIKNAEFLTELPALEILKLSELASIWLDEYSLDKLPVKGYQKRQIKKYINKLDEIANTLNGENSTDEDKIKNITYYLIDHYDYDHDIYDEKTGYDLSVKYNRRPISESFKSDEIICINYTCLFQALANRLNIDSTIITNENHGWNIADFDGVCKGIDVTNIDNASQEEKILRYKFDIENNQPLYSGAIYPKEPVDIDKTIGYVNKTKFEIGDILYVLDNNLIGYRFDNIMEIAIIFGVLVIVVNFLGVTNDIKKLNELEEKTYTKK